MSRTLSLAFLLLSFSWCRLAVADDAYDDEEGVERPEETDFDDESKDEEAEGDGLKAGGLRAPDALGEAGDTRSDIEKDLDESDEKDSGRGLEFAWLGAEVGFQSAGLTALGESGLLPDGSDSSGSGIAFGGAAGVRVLYFTLGPRFRYGSLGSFRHWSLVAEVALRIPLGKLEPYALLGGGYARITDVAGVEPFGGADFRLAGGVHYYLSDSFSIGAQIGGDVLLLSGTDGSSTGAGVTASTMLGLHF